MSTVSVESLNYRPSESLEDWQQPRDEQPIYCNLPLKEGQQPLDFAVEDSAVMMNNVATVLTANEQQVLNVLLRNRHQRLGTEQIMAFSLAEDNIKLHREGLYKALLELDVKMNQPGQVFLEVEKGKGNRARFYGIADTVIYTGTIATSTHTPRRPQLPLVETLNWAKGSACLTAKDDEMVPETRGAEAKAIANYCANCGVVKSCLAEALAKDDHYGVRGGKSGIERERMLSAMKAEDKGYETAVGLQQAAGQADVTTNVVPLRAKSA